jgi:hypothetical protein
MASREEIQRLRELARKRHRAATQKVSRLRAKGVEIKGTHLDPRRSAGDIQKMRSRDLHAYINRLDKFSSRETSFVGGARNAPLHGDLWKTYQTLQNAVNQQKARPYETIKDKFIRSLGMTVNEFQGTKPSHPITGNPASRAPHLPVNRSAKGVPNEKQLKKLIRNMEKQLNANYPDRVLNRDRRTADKMLAVINDKGIRREVKKLSQQEFNLLWNYTDFANIASFDYQIAQTRMQDPKAVAAYDAAFDTQIREMKKRIHDVKALDLVRQSANLTP